MNWWSPTVSGTVWNTCSEKFGNVSGKQQWRRLANFQKGLFNKNQTNKKIH